jgi:PTS system nitrogen regulatory IIA component
MELRVRDVARLLNVSEPTVYRWVRQGALAAHRVGEQYRFHRVSPELFTPPGSPEATFSLQAALERGGVYREVPGERRDQVLAAIAELPGIPSGVNRSQLAQLLIGRETLASTAVGDGIAIPHPRDPLVVGVEEPHVLLCFLGRPVDFGAIDGLPVRALFTLLAPSVRQHLQILAKLAFVLHDPALRELLNRVAPQRAILDRIRALEGPPAHTPAPRDPAAIRFTPR